MSRLEIKSSSAVRLIFAMCIAEILGMVGIFGFPTLLPRFMEAWRLTNTEAGWINGIYFAGYTAAVPILVGLTDRVDARRIYLAFTAAGGIAAIGFALLASGFWTALIFRALAGLGLAGTFVPGLKALVDRLQGKAQARAVSFYTATFSLGTSLSFFATGRLDALLGWRWAFAFSAVGSVFALLLAGAVLQPGTPASGSGTTGPLFDFQSVSRNRRARGYILSYAVHCWELFSVRSWMVAFLTFSLSLQPHQANFLSPSSVAALAALVAMWASVAGGELALRFDRSRTISLIMGISALLACGIGFTAMLPYPAVICLFLFYSLFVQGDSAALHAGVVLSAEKERQGAAMAVQSVLGFGCAFVGPLVTGVVLDITGSGKTLGSWGAAFISMGLVVALGPLFLALLVPKNRQADK